MGTAIVQTCSDKLLLVRKNGLLDHRSILDQRMIDFPWGFLYGHLELVHAMMLILHIHRLLFFVC